MAFVGCFLLAQLQGGCGRVVRLLLSSQLSESRLCLRLWGEAVGAG